MDSPTINRREFIGASASLLALAAQSAAAEDAWTQTSDKKIRIGIVGGRFGLAWHWHEHPNCVVHAVSDLIPERRDQLVGKYQCENTHESLEKLVLDPDIDAVAVFTGAPDHARHVEICFEHGKHVISACPACLTLEEAAKMKEVKERTGLKYMNAETSWYRWETQLAREAHAKGQFGDLLYCEAEYYHPKIGRDGDSLSFFKGERTWRYGFPPMLYPTHSTAFLTGVTGERLTHVSCIGQGDPDEPSLKDNQYDNPFLNGIGLFETDRGNPFRCNVAWNLHAHGERAQWFGTKAALYMDGPGGQPFSLREEGRNSNQKPDYWRRLPETMRYDSGHGASHPFITNEFITALVEDREPAVDMYESLALCVPGIVAHESSLKGGERLALPSFDTEKK